MKATRSVIDLDSLPAIGKAGDVPTANNLGCIRPGRGLSPKYSDLLLGRRVNRDVKRGTPMT